VLTYDKVKEVYTILDW